MMVACSRTPTDSRHSDPPDSRDYVQNGETSFGNRIKHGGGREPRRGQERSPQEPGVEGRWPFVIMLVERMLGIEFRAYCMLRECPTK